MFAELALNLPAQGVSFLGLVPGEPELANKTNGLVYATAPVWSGTLNRVLGVRKLIRSLIKTKKVDLVATHFALYAAGAMPSIRKFPHVVHFHGPWAAESAAEDRHRAVTSAMYRMERFVYNSADRVIVLSDAFAQVAIRDYFVPEEKVRIVPGSADIRRFALPVSKAQARLELGWPLDRPILIAVRRLSARMGLDKLIDAMASVSRKYPDALLYIGGKGKLLDALRRATSDLRLEKNVEFLGFIPDDRLALAYCAADINVVPSSAWEGFGLVAAEALAAGTPSMVTPMGGLPEIVTSLTSDLLFESASADHIAEGLIEALSGARSLPSRQECQDYAALNFASTTMAQRTANVYRELVGHII